MASANTVFKKILNVNDAIIDDIHTGQTCTGEKTHEGIAFYSAGTTPVYRAYNPNSKSGEHDFTTDLSYHNKLISMGWRDEGIAWYQEE